MTEHSSSPFAEHFAPTRGYLSAATAGLPTIRTVRALHDSIDAWVAGTFDPVGCSRNVERCRELFARIACVEVDRVAVGSQVSQFVSIVGTAVPDGGEVLCAEGDFASLTHPFEQLAGRGVTVRYVPLARLAESIRPESSIVAVSHVQSATGEIADLAAIAEAAAQQGTRTLLDLTQSLGWLPVDASGFDYTICHSYKWLCCPRGVTFMTVRDGLDDTLTPLAAGWCSADEVWESCYAGCTPLAAGAGRFDVSPVWQAVEGSVPALDLFASLDGEAVRAHAVGLANAARRVLGQPAGESAIVSWSDPDGSDLQAMRAAGIAAAGRAGNARISFHLWNDQADVDLLAEALGRRA